VLMIAIWVRNLQVAEASPTRIGARREVPLADR
jgi:hypothetical protein